MDILVHTCCSNCAIYPVKFLKQNKFNPTLFWYNFNIHPYSEYKLRLDSLKKLQQHWFLNIIYEESYKDFYKFLREVVGKEKERCEICYRIRLEKTVKKACEIGINLFTTTLLVSPYQNFDKIVFIAKELAERHKVNFYDKDFREGYKESIKISKELGLYRQKYCGCIYSEAEKHLRKIDYE
ncbi:MAG: epoxyqueuosine reductase QueH [Thermodesulfovibrionaceae bacterium]